MLPHCISQRPPKHLRPWYYQYFNDAPVLSEVSAGTLRLVRLHGLFVINICMEKTSLCQSILVRCLWGGTLWKSLFW